LAPVSLAPVCPYPYAALAAQALLHLRAISAGTVSHLGVAAYPGLACPYLWVESLDRPCPSYLCLGSLDPIRPYLCLGSLGPIRPYLCLGSPGLAGQQQFLLAASF